MFCNREKGKGRLKSPLSKLKKGIIYLSIIIVPLIYYPLKVDGRAIDLRSIRQIAFFSFAVIICSFLQRSRWLRYFVIWCVVGWWLNFFWPSQICDGLIILLSALVIYIGMTKLLETKLLNMNILIKLIAFAGLFQFLWMVILQTTNHDPIFHAVAAGGAVLDKNVPLVGWSGNPSLLGIYLAMTSFLFLSFCPIIFFIIAIPTIFLLNNATTTICFCIGGMFYILNRYRINKKIILISVGILLLLILSFIHIKSPNFDRLPIWKSLITDGIKIRPIVGKGLNFFSELHIVDKTGTPWSEAHNDYLQLILETGIVGFLLFFGFLISKYHQFFIRKKNDVENNVQICLMTSLTVFLVSGLSLFPMHLAQMSFTGIILLALLEFSYNDNKCLSSVSI